MRSRNQVVTFKPFGRRVWAGNDSRCAVLYTVNRVQSEALSLSLSPFALSLPSSSLRSLAVWEVINAARHAAVRQGSVHQRSARSYRSNIKDPLPRLSRCTTLSTNSALGEYQQWEWAIKEIYRRRDWWAIPWCTLHAYALSNLFWSTRLNAQVNSD